MVETELLRTIASLQKVTALLEVTIAVMLLVTLPVLVYQVGQIRQLLRDRRQP